MRECVLNAPNAVKFVAIFLACLAMSCCEDGGSISETSSSQRDNAAMDSSVNQVEALEQAITLEKMTVCYHIAGMLWLNDYERQDEWKTAETALGRSALHRAMDLVESFYLLTPAGEMGGFEDIYRADPGIMAGAIVFGSRDAQKLTNPLWGASAAETLKVWNQQECGPYRLIAETSDE